MKIGLFVPSIGNNQLSIQAIANLNSFNAEEEKIYPALFYKETSDFILKLKGICTTFEKMYNYDGHIITTNLDTTFIALKCPRLKSINFYLTDLEWIHGVGTYLTNIIIYKNEKVNVICPSLEYADAIENYCNLKVDTIIPGFNFNEIIRTVSRRNS